MVAAVVTACSMLYKLNFAFFMNEDVIDARTIRFYRLYSATSKSYMCLFCFSSAGDRGVFTIHKIVLFYLARNRSNVSSVKISDKKNCIRKRGLACSESIYFFQRTF